MLDHFPKKILTHFPNKIVVVIEDSSRLEAEPLSEEIPSFIKEGEAKTVAVYRLSATRKIICPIKTETKNP